MGGEGKNGGVKVGSTMLVKKHILGRSTTLKSGSISLAGLEMGQEIPVQFFQILT